MFTIISLHKAFILLVSHVRVPRRKYDPLIVSSQAKELHISVTEIGHSHLITAPILAVYTTMPIVDSMFKEHNLREPNLTFGELCI